MKHLICSLTAPVHIQDRNTLSIPPVIFSGNVYVIDDNKLSILLQRIGLHRDYSQYISEFGNTGTIKWLANKDLMNEGLLENISKYWMKSESIRKINDYRTFEKDSSGYPVISKDNFIEVFKNSITFDYISSKKIEYNHFMKKQLDKIEKELSVIQDIIAYSNHQNFYKNNIFEYLSDKFIENNNFDPSEKLQKIEQMNISVRSTINLLDLSVCRIGVLEGFKGNNIVFTDVSQCECVKDDVSIRIETEYDLTEPLEKTQTMINEKINFDSNTILSMLNKEDSKNLIGSKNTDSMQKCGNIALVEPAQHDSKSENLIIKKYNELYGSNMIFENSKELRNMIYILSLDNENRQRINRLIYGRENHLETWSIKVALNKGNLPESPVGYATLSC